MIVESLHIGLNRVDSSEYHDWPGYLPDAIHDARDLSLTAARYGCKARALFDEDAKIERVSGELKAMAGRLHAGDAFVLSYSGHGSTSPIFGDEDKQAWCLFDGEHSDRALRSLLAKFEDGVAGLVLIDSCYSGGMDRDRQLARVKPYWVKARTRATGDSALLRAAIVMMTASTSQEESMSTGRNGAWTGSLLATLKEFEDRNLHPTWEEWNDATVRVMSLKYPMQHPQVINLSGQTFIGSKAWTFATAPTPVEPPPTFPTDPGPSQ